MKIGPYTFTKCEDYRDAPELPGIVIARCSRSMNAAIFQTSNIKRFISNNRVESIRNGNVTVQTSLKEYLEDHPRRSLVFGFLTNCDNPMVSKKDIKTVLLVTNRQLATQRQAKRYVVVAYKHKASGSMVVTFGHDGNDTNRQLRLMITVLRKQRITTHGNAHSERVQFKINYPYVEQSDFERVATVRVTGRALAEKRKAELIAHYSKQAVILNF